VPAGPRVGQPGRRTRPNLRQQFAHDRYDSNLFANAAGAGDTSYSLSFGADYVRRAGWIGLNASVGVNATRYGKFTREDFENPTFTAAFSKQSGRTTGSLTLSAARESRADVAANLATKSCSTRPI